MSRLPTHLVVGALLRRVNDAGGFAVVRTRGDADAGAVLVLVVGKPTRLLERGRDAQGREVLVEPRRTDAEEPVDDYWRRRRSRDPDLWVVELDAPDAAAIAAKGLLLGAD